MAIYRTRVDWFWGIVILLVLFLLPILTKEGPFFTTEAASPVSVVLIGIMTNLFIAIIAVTGLNILLGYTGQISLGHAAFMMVGAYASQVLVDQLGITFWLALPLAAGFTGLVGLLFGIPSLRVKGFYLAMATLAAQFMIPWFIKSYKPTWFDAETWNLIGLALAVLSGVLVSWFVVTPMLMSLYEQRVRAGQASVDQMQNTRKIVLGVSAVLLSVLFILPLSNLGDTLTEIDLGGETGKAVSAPRIDINLPGENDINLVLNNNLSMYYVCLVSVLIFGGAARNIIRSRIGRALISVRDNDLAAEQLGINVFRYKLLAFFIAAVYAGIAGSLLAHSSRSIAPTTFNLERSINYLGMLVIGGVGFPLGPTFGASFYYLVKDYVIPEITPVLRERLPEILTFVNPTNVEPALFPLMFGLLLMGFLIFEPRGIAHRWAIMQASWRLRPFSQA